MIYQFKSGSFIRADAQIAGEMCERLAEQGTLTPRSLLDANRDENAPLHNCFEWDDNAAAELYRESQARHIINCLCVVSKEKEPVRAYFNIVSSESPGYQHVNTIMQKQDDTERLLEMALKELEAFKRKYNQLRQLAPVFNALDSLERKVSA